MPMLARYVAFRFSVRSYSPVLILLLIPHHFNHHDGAVGAHAGVEPEWGLAVVLVEDGAHGSVLAGNRDGEDGVVWLGGLDVGELECQAVAAQ